MTTNDITQKTVGIIAADGVERVEVTAPRDALARAGVDVKVLSPDGASVRGYHYVQPESEIPVDGSIAEADAAAFDAVVVPGGLGGPDTLRTDRDAVGFVTEVARHGLVGVICHGPWVLIEADLLAGRTLTCVDALRSDVSNSGAHYVDDDVHVDRDADPKLVSGRNFKAAGVFAETLVAELAA